MQTPFPFETIAPKEFFYGREKELNELKAHISNSTNVLLFSKRRMGKSTLIKNLFDEIEKDFVVIYIDIYNIITAEDGIDALEKMREKKPDLVVTDVDMPRLNGLDLVTRMKETLALSDIPIIVVTGNVELHFKIGAHEGVDSFLPKPYSANDLLGQTKFLLGQ